MPDAHDASFAKEKRVKGIRSFSVNPCWGTSLSKSNMKVCNQCKMLCLLKNLEDAARAGAKLYNESIEVMKWVEEGRPWPTNWRPMYPPILDKVCAVIELYDSDFDPDNYCQCDGKRIDEDEMILAMRDCLAAAQPFDPDKFASLFSRTPSGAIPTSAPKGMRMKYKNIKMHERSAMHYSKFGKDWRVGVVSGQSLFRIPYTIDNTVFACSRR